MKGFKDKSGKFRPTESRRGMKKPDGKSIQPSGLRMQRGRDDYSTILKNNLESFNKHHKIKLEYGSDGGSSNGLKFAGTNSFIQGKMSKSQAIDFIQFLEQYLMQAGADI